MGASGRFSALFPQPSADWGAGGGRGEGGVSVQDRLWLHAGGETGGSLRILSALNSKMFVSHHNTHVLIHISFLSACSVIGY